uniref:Uncharacterized protein n=1 Tax=Anguilla anguilla TaxID=7936 RepID=A0A0E9VHD1_ANGAN
MIFTPNHTLPLFWYPEFGGPISSILLNEIRYNNDAQYLNISKTVIPL